MQRILVRQDCPLLCSVVRQEKRLHLGSGLCKIQLSSPTSCGLGVPIRKKNGAVVQCPTVLSHIKMRIVFRIKKKSLQQFCLEFLRASSCFRREMCGKARRVSREPPLRASAPELTARPLFSLPVPVRWRLRSGSRGWSVPCRVFGLGLRLGSAAGSWTGFLRGAQQAGGGRGPLGPSGILAYRMVYSLCVVSRVGWLTCPLELEPRSVTCRV